MSCLNLGKPLVLRKSGNLPSFSGSNKDSLMVKGFISALMIQDQKRTYSSGNSEYDLLWEAVTSGRGTGRRKKTNIVKGIDPKLLKYDKAGLKWKGYNVPINDEVELDRDEEGITEKPKKTGDRGWAGKGWPGRKCGNPFTADGRELSDFSTVCIELRRVSNTTSNGRKKSLRALVVAGNKNGLAGFGVGRGKSALSAITEAKNRAVNYLYHFERCDNHTIFHDMETKYHCTKINFFRKPRGFGLRCHRAIKEIAILIGIEDMRCKVYGETNPISLVRAVFQGLLSQETHQQLADRTGFNVVEFRAECGNRPMIVASPSDEARNKALKKRSEKAEYNFNEVFDPYRGLHRPKKVVDLF